MRKKSLSLALALVLALSLAVPGLAASTSVTMIRTDYTGANSPDNGVGWSYTEFSDGLAPVRDDETGKMNYINTNGKLILPQEYNCFGFSEGMALVEKNEKLGYIDRTGKVIIPLQYDEAGYFSNGLAPVKKNGKCGYIDRTGKIVLSVQYDEALPFSEGLAAVEKDGKWGYIDTTGKVIIPLNLEYDYADAFSDGLAIVMKQVPGEHFVYSKYGYIDRTGKEAIPLKYDAVEPFSNGFAAVWKDSLKDTSTMYLDCGVIDHTGKVIVPLEYDEVGDFSDGLARVWKRNEDGTYLDNYVDTTGKLLVFKEYYCGDFFEGLASVTKADGDKYGYIDRTGKMVIPQEYDWAGNFFDGLAVVAKDERYGYTDRTGKVVIPLKYDAAASFSEGLAAVEQDGKWGYIDQTGKLVIPFQYDEAYAFSEGLATIMKNGKGGFIDTSGKLVASFPFHFLYDVTFSNGIAVVTDDNDKLVIFKKSGFDQPSTPVIPSFLDVSAGAYYASPVQWAVEKEITAGTSATTFSPDNTCTTAQILTFLWRAKGSPAPTKRDPSVPSGQYYSDAANWALEKGLTEQFTANAPATRLATVTYLWKLAGSPAVTGGTSFTDVTENTQAVAWAVKQGITKGTSDTTFSPSTTCTRGQIVTFLHRDLAE